MKNLRVRTLFLAGIVLALTMGLLSQPAQARFYIDIPGTDPCVAGVPFTIEIRMNNNTGANVYGITNGFRIYSPNGATWQTPTYDTAGGLGQYFDGGVSLNGFSVDGSGADTIGLGGFRMVQPGVPNGYDDIILRIMTTPSSDGDTLCIDSAWFPPAGTWLWATPSGSVVPSWEGPYCWMVVPQTSIAGYKFDDLDFDSEWDGGEPGLPNWEINLWDGPNLIGQTLTDVNGYYEFFIASAGTYGVSESNQLGWVQTYPLTVFYMIDLQQGDNLTGFDFGNCDTLCEDSVRWDTCFAGTMDDFVGPEPCHWSQEMENWITQFNHIENFDEPAVNQYFGHTIEGCWDDDCLVLEATLTIRMTPSASGGCANDCIALGEYKTVGGMSFWWTYISELCGDNSWDFGDVETFTLDLANLPVTGHDRTNNILAGLQDGTIDIVVQDDSKVDWIQLEVKLCCPFCYADGDANNDGIGLTTTDLAYLDAFITGPGPAPIPLYSCDLNGDGVVDIADLQLYNDYFIYGIGVFAPYGGYPVKCPCYPTAAPVVDTVSIYGMEHRSLDWATLTTDADTLKITRLNPDGGDGVVIDLRDMCHSWDALMKNPDFGDTLPEGASLSIVTTAVIDGTPDSVVNEMSQTKVGDDRVLAVTTDAPSLTLQGYQGDSLVFELEGYTGDGSRYHEYVVGVVLGGPSHLDTIWGNDFHQEIKWYSGGGGNSGYVIVSYYTYNGIVVGWKIEDQTIWVDKIGVIPEMATPMVEKPTFSEIIISTQDIPSLEFVSESYGVEAFPGIHVSNLGNAILTPVGTTLVVGNIGSSGFDGMSCEPEDGDYPEDLIWASVAIIMENPDLSGDLPIGSEIRGVTEKAFTNANGDRYYVDLAISYTKNATNIWDLAVEAEATLYSVEAYRDDTLVFNVDSIPVDGLGQIVETAKGVHPVGFQGGSTGKEATLSCVWQAPDNVQWTWAAHGVSNLEIDKLSVTAEDDDTTLVGISSASILGSNGAKSDPISFTILSITAEPTSCCQNRGDADGSGAIDVGDLTYLVAYLFQGGPEPSCPEEGDVDGSGATDVGDLTYLVAYLFQGGDPPPDCGATPKMSLGKVTRSDVSLSTTCDDDGATTIMLKSAVDLRGLQIDLRGEGNNRTVKLVDQALELYFHQDGDEARIGIIDLEGAALINKGTSALVKLDGEYEIIEAVASDLSHNTFSPAINSAAKTAELPHDFALHQNYPNPFNPSTQINFSLPQASNVKLEVYNVLGQQVVTLLDDFREAGAHTVSWNSTDNSGKQVSSGVYFYRIQAADFTDTRKMLLLK